MLYLSTTVDANTKMRKIYSLRKVKNDYVVRKYTWQIQLRFTKLVHYHQSPSRHTALRALRNVAAVSTVRRSVIVKSYTLMVSELRFIVVFPTLST